MVQASELNDIQQTNDSQIQIQQRIIIDNLNRLENKMLHKKNVRP